ncbi:MAG: acylneuraminate cytidylyltransferase [Bacteroidia bacterium]|nr:acylneuraminate cytidylyltransferase [Bacteroidia bacterium]
MSDVLAIIPARGGSKGIPGKNIRPVAGRSLLAWSIEAALAAKCVNRVIVSTDDDQIASVALSCGSEVVTRPKSISGDDASSESALLHVLDFLKENESYIPDRVVFLQATSPYRDVHDIDNAYVYMDEGNYDSVFSGYSQHFSGRWRRENDESFSAVSYDPYDRPMRQMVADEFVENGSIYIFETEGFIQKKNRLFGRIGMYEMPLLRSFQIDDLEDINLMERLMAKRGKPSSLNAKDFLKTELLVLDFDGVMTDNSVYLTQSGEEAVKCSRADGLGIAEILKKGIRVMVLSTEKNPVVRARCEKLGIACSQGIDDKLSLLQSIVDQEHIDVAHVTYVGNDRNDMACMKWVGNSVAVSDAYPEILEIADYVTKAPGGCGAVREICDCIVAMESK